MFSVVNSVEGVRGAHWGVWLWVRDLYATIIWAYGGALGGYRNMHTSIGTPFESCGALSKANASAHCM